MKWRSLSFALAVGCLNVPFARAFETHTHAYITYQAYGASLLGGSGTESQALMTRLGLDRLESEQPFSPYWTGLPIPLSFYYDNLPDGLAPLSFTRPAGPHEWWQMYLLATNNQFGVGNTGVVGNDPIHKLPIANWLMRGVILEDQIRSEDYRASDGPLPDPDPRGDIRRVFNHFYDPIHDQRLTVNVPCNLFPPVPPFYGYSYCSKSVDWALGTQDAFTSIAPDTTRHNHFSWQDARQNYFLALTATRDANGDGVRSASERAADAQERMFRWATVFRSLGDVVHLLQDTGQPQHTRNDRHDPHSGSDERQAFEPFTNMRVIGIPAQGQRPQPAGDGENYVYGLNGAQVLAYMGPLAGINGYPKPAFASPLGYYTSRQLGDTDQSSPVNRLGLADYTNRGFFTRGTLPGGNGFNFPPQDVADGINGYTAADTPCSEMPVFRDRRPVSCRTYFHTVPDNIAPGRADVTTPQPLVGEGMWKNFLGSLKKFTLSPAIFKAQGDLTVPRAIGYSAGLIDFFFRGQLEVTPIDQSVFAVLNQGDPHTMDVDGYPRKSSDPTKIFGFEALRLKVRNVTPTIVESGTGTNVPQTTGGGGAQLVAIARYHRNACYQPDMAGERVQAYDGTVTDPSCAGNRPVRTNYQEISVSAPLTVAAGELDSATPAEKMFDFSADPIPVNATDLFIQVAYRGKLGEEPDGIAVGTYDVSEPTFAAAWNNTDYFWNGTSWVAQNAGNPQRGVYSYWACAGVPSRFIYRYGGTPGSFAMTIPPSPGYVRLALLFGKPANPAQRFAVRSVPIMQSSPQMSQRSAFTRGQIRQASKELVTPATLAAPFTGCFVSPPAAPEYWCFDPVQRRRGIAWGDMAQPLYASATDGTDVDSVPLPAFASAQVRDGGENKFNEPGALAACPQQPTATPEETEYLEMLEEAEFQSEG